MDNLDDSENNAKISDSAYSNSCSNSQSRRSHSSKSTHSGSNSSGSSGYGGKPSTSGSSNNLAQQPKKDKEGKKKKLPQAETPVTEAIEETELRPPEPAPDFDSPEEETVNVISTQTPVEANIGVENMDICISDIDSTKDEVVAGNMPMVNSTMNLITARSTASNCPDGRLQDGFSCVISMHDGVVMYTTLSLTTTLGYPKEMWIGRSFIDFVHPRDHNTFASQITKGLAVPKNVNGTQVKAHSPADLVSTMVCRIRRYRGLSTGFGIKDKKITYMPFLLKLTFKNVSDEEGKVTYLVIQATPFFSAFKTPYELINKSVPFVIRHSANGTIEYVDPESVPYLGHLPQDLADKDALQLYHPDDLHYLRQVYEVIVKEGRLPRSRAYRMLTQNGDYLKLETEWSSFINPWSRKLEFVTGKHYIIEGPANPDVFLTPELDKTVKIPEEERKKAVMLRENIIRILNEVLTKPAEVAKQQMTKRCQDLASFMESLIEDQPKADEELRIEIQEPDHSYYERDSVMLGGISPHHEYNDSKSSTETPLSYNQLNYNENLQRYFDSHPTDSYDYYNTVGEENILALKDAGPIINHCLSPMAENSGDSAGITNSSDSNMITIGSNSPVNQLGDFQAMRLTESLLNRHNSEMERELMKNHREARSSSKGERDKATNQKRQKKKEHLARCNASYQPTSVGVRVPSANENQPHGVKRPSKHIESENSAHKHHCSSQRQSRRARHRTDSTSEAVTQPSATNTTTVASTNWQTPAVNNMNTFYLGVGIPPQMPIMSPVAMPGMFPMYYAPVSAQSAMPSTSNMPGPSAPGTQFQATPMPCMIYPQTIYGQPFMYSPISPQVSYPMQQTRTAQSMQYTNTMNQLGLTSSNYEEACKPGLTLRPSELSGPWRKKIRADSKATSSITDQGSAVYNSSTKALNREMEAHSSQFGNEKSATFSSDMKSSSKSYSPKSTEAVSQSSPPTRSGLFPHNKLNRLGNSDDAVDKTDGESSYSSFYSSFFKTESGSAEESGDAKKPDSNEKRFQSATDIRSSYYEPQEVKKVPKRKTVPPWMEQVCMTSELIYKYQILTKSLDEVLSEDKKKLSSFEQPSLVNDQLEQLYLDLHLQGVAAKLTLEEGITSSSSSGEETSTNSTKVRRRKREYSKLVMIYEEDAPLPPPDGEPEPDTASTSTF